MKTTTPPNQQSGGDSFLNLIDELRLDLARERRGRLRFTAAFLEWLDHRGETIESCYRRVFLDEKAQILQVLRSEHASLVAMNAPEHLVASRAHLIDTATESLERMSIEPDMACWDPKQELSALIREFTCEHIQTAAYCDDVKEQVKILLS